MTKQGEELKACPLFLNGKHTPASLMYEETIANCPHRRTPTSDATEKDMLWKIHALVKNNKTSCGTCYTIRELLEPMVIASDAGGEAIGDNCDICERPEADNLCPGRLIKDPKSCSGFIPPKPTAQEDEGIKNVLDGCDLEKLTVTVCGESFVSKKQIASLQAKIAEKEKERHGLKCELAGAEDTVRANRRAFDRINKEATNEYKIKAELRKQLAEKERQIEADRIMIHGLKENLRERDEDA